MEGTQHRLWKVLLNIGEQKQLGGEVVQAALAMRI